MNIRRFFILASAVGAFSCSMWSQNAHTPAIAVQDMDLSIRPQDDFYHYVNGGWIKNNPLKPAYSRFGTFDVLRDSTQERVRQIVEELSHGNYAPNSNEYRVATLYKQAMDTETRNRLGVKPIRPELLKISAIRTKKDLVKYAAYADNKGEGALFSTYVFSDPANSDMNILHISQPSLALGDRDYYLSKEASSQAILDSYVQYTEKLLRLAGYDNKSVQRMAKNNLKIAKQLAEMSYSALELRDSHRNYNMVEVATFAQQNKGFNWKEYLAIRRFGAVKSWNVAQMDFFKKFDRWFAKVNLNEYKDYLIVNKIDAASDYLSEEFAQANFDFYGKVLSGKQEMHPLWKRSVNVVNGVLGEALGEVYVKKYFPQEAKDRMIEMISNLQEALKERIQGLTWMSEATKQKGIEKLSTFKVKVGFPDQWKDYSKLHIDENLSYYENLQRAQQFEHDNNVAEWGKPVDMSKWLMNPQDVNAYYMPTTNEICFPAGILQPPFFNIDADDAVNYGAIGVVIGHEMTHGFDDQGRNFDKDGNMNDWWTEQDSKQFTATAKKLADQYSAIRINENTMANGEFTLGENIADQGGLLMAYLAFSKTEQARRAVAIEGFTPAQRFFIGYARLWGQNITEQEKERLTKIDVHSLGINRVNQALKNIDAFYTAFEVKDTDPMFLAPKDRVVVW